MFLNSRMDPENASSHHDLNDLFDYDVGLEDIREGNAAQAATADGPKPPVGDPSTLGLGVDEEVKVNRKRQPVAKLDENRLLSQPGIPKLRRVAKQKLRFKGKGHEFSDAARLLNFYQLWLDDLFPRAKFADGLTMIEKLGHSKRIQTMRREWIEEEKPKMFGDREISREAPDIADLSIERSSDGNNGAAAEGPQDSSAHLDAMQEHSGGVNSALFISDARGEAHVANTHPEPDDDALEDLLREQDEAMLGTLSEPKAQTTRNALDDFDEEYEAMNELGM